jgi:protease-4
MSFNQTLSAILRGRWLIDKSWAESHIPLVLSMLKGNPVSFVERSGHEEFEQPFAIDPVTMNRYDLYRWDWLLEKYIPNPNIPEGSIGILPIAGPITKYNGYCGEPGAILHSSRLAEMGKRNNIAAVILLVDTPGGEARAAHSFVTAIDSFKKPIISYVDDMAASLGMWLISATDEVYLSNKAAQVGSIGSYCTIYDWSGYFEKEGIKIHEIYAPQSTDKNKDYREALKGNYDLIEEELKVHVDEFIGFIKKKKPGTAPYQKEWDSGKMFFSDEAMKYGLIDGVKNFEQVISKASWLAKRNKKS